MEMNHFAQLFRRIQGFSGNTALNTLILNQDVSLSNSLLLQARCNSGSVCVACLNQMQLSAMQGVMGNFQAHDGYCHVSPSLISNISIRKYDVVVAMGPGNVQLMAVDALKPDFVLFQGYVQGQCIPGYSWLCPGVMVNQDVKGVEVQQVQGSDAGTENVNHGAKAESRDWLQKAVKSVAASPVKYGKFQMNYAYGMEQGLVTVIIVINTQGGDAAGLIKGIKAQQLPKTQFIVIDNGIGVKSAIGQRIAVSFRDPVPDEWCMRVGMQLSRGQFIFRLTSQSQEPDLKRQLVRGRFHTR